MTIASQTSRIAYTGDGSTTTFAVPFFFSANADLVVYLMDTGGNTVLQILGTNYNLAGAGVSAGGTCTFTIAPTAGYTISIYRDPPVTQTTSYNNNDPFPAKSHEAALDKGVTIDQRTRDLVTRSVHLDDADAASNMIVPTLPIRTGKVAGYSPIDGSFTVSNNTLATLDSVLSGALATSGGFNRIIIFTSQAALKASTPFAGAVAYLEGFTSPGDNGQGIFIWNASSVAADDFGTIIQPNAGGVGRWIRSGNPPIVVATQAALKALVPYTGAVAYMEGFYAAGDAGAGMFVWNASSVAADNVGTIVQPNAGGAGRWLRSGLSSGLLRLEWFGGAGDNLTDNLAAFNLAFAALPTTGGSIEFGPGKFKFSAAVSKTMTNGRQTIHLRGQGVDVTTLYWPAGGGLTITNAHTNNYVNIHDLTFSTGAGGGGVGLNLATTGGALAFGGVSSLARLSFRGDDYDSQTANSLYWGVCLKITNWNNVNIDSIHTASIFTLTGGGTGAGIGLEYGGISPNICAVLNVQNSMFFYHNIYVQLDNYWEGVTFTNNQFDGQVGGVGLFVPANSHAGPLLQLIGNQFNTGGQQIDLVASVTQVILHANTITVYGDNNFGALLGTCTDAIVTGNMFNHATGANTTALSINGPDGTVNGNIFLGVALGVSLGASSSNINLSQNTYNCTTTVANAAGAANHVGVATQ